MNAKKLKSLRKAIRARGQDVREVVLSSGDTPRYMGQWHMGQRILEKSCGRAFYQIAKRTIKRGGNKHQAVRV